MKRQKLVSGRITFVNQFVLFENMKKERRQFQIKKLDLKISWKTCDLGWKIHSPPLNNTQKVMVIPKIALKNSNPPPKYSPPLINNDRSLMQFGNKKFYNWLNLELIWLRLMK